MFWQSLFNLCRSVVDVVVFGDHRGGCDNEDAGNGAMCHCNQGDQTVYMRKRVETNRAEMLAQWS